MALSPRLAIDVSTRLWLAGVVSVQRDKALADGLLQRVRACCRAIQALLICTDGWNAYPQSIRRAFREKVKKTAGRGRACLEVWPDLCIATVIKRTEKKRVVKVTRKLTWGTLEKAQTLLKMTVGCKHSLAMLAWLFMVCFPARKGKSRDMIIMILLILFFSGLGIFFLYMSVALLLMMRRVRLKGRLTSGLVVNRRKEVTRSSRGNINNYYALVAYEVDGKTYTRDIPVSRESYESWLDGRAVDVRYLSDQPERGFLPNDNEPTTMVIGGLLTAIIFLAVAAFMIADFVSRRW